MVPVSAYLAVSAVMFLIGTVGFAVRRNAIVAFMCIELMLNAVNITLVAFTRSGVGPNGETVALLDGQIAVFFVMVVAAAEAAIGLAIIISLFRAFQSVETTEAGELKH